MKNKVSLLALIITIGFSVSSCQQAKKIEIVRGVSKAIAEYRSLSISNPEYDLHFIIPDSINQPIQATEKITFDLNRTDQPLILDFSPSPDFIREVEANGYNDFEITNGHIIIPKSSLKKGKNTINIVFRAGETSLNRNPEFLYTLFVPDRASTAFPCFDQPDMKARYTLNLDIPESWTAVANGAETNTVIDEESGKKNIQFSKTEKLSTYLFSFAAGKFQKITRNIDGREISMFHREPDSMLVKQNVDEIFNLHARALNWLEDYTQIKYPFQKFDFVAIPFFQYGGMEHAGAILYRANSLFLEDNATQNQKLGRAGLISHETSHMWFGDYVTMQWFDDVWLKEVFAGFMSDKIVSPSFPDINHDLKFLLSRYPAAYEIDRTQGANPIGQKLDNMKDAGSLYGGIIYNKAPIVMLHLENIMGAEKLQLGLQEYLKQYAYSDATWDQLIQILNKQTEADLEAWSQIWVKEAGMPTIKTAFEITGDKIANFRLDQSDPFGRDRIWPQKLSVGIFYSDRSENQKVTVNFGEKEIAIPEFSGRKIPELIIPNSDGSAYGYFEMDETSINFLLSEIQNMNDPMLKGIAWLNLWENMLNNNVDKNQLYQTHLNALLTETDPLLISRILSQTSTIFWQFLTPEERLMKVEESENLLWKLLEETEDNGLRKNYFNSFENLALSDQALNKLFNIWDGKLKVKNLSLSPNDQTGLAYTLALKLPEKSTEIINKQIERIQNPDRRAEIEFVAPALSNDPAIRDLFFSSLKSPVNREHERWVVTAINFLNHPLRADYSIKYLYESLELLQEIQITGDIFFPKQWLDAVLGGYQSAAANQIVHQFLQDHPDYPENLKAKILQSADFLFRSQDIVNK